MQVDSKKPMTDDFSVLVVDDNELNRWVLAEQLQQWPFTVAQAEDGRIALGVMQTQSFSMAFIDINMPGMNGIELVNAVRQTSPNRFTPMIAVTALSDPDQRRVLLERGFDDILIKPISLSDLQNIVRTWAGHIGLRLGNQYADALLDKCEQNADIANRMLERLCDQTPSELAQIEEALMNDDYERAKEMAHKIHGTFCFYGFADFRQLAMQLERALIDGDSDQSKSCLRLLKERLLDLVSDRDEISMRITAKM